MAVADLSRAGQSKGQASGNPKARGPVAIVDIGSNSVRLVVYEAQNRIAASLQNEKSICGIGRDMVTTGRLHAEGCEAALEALSRFRMISDGLHVEHRDAVMRLGRCLQHREAFLRKLLTVRVDPAQMDFLAQHD